MVYFNKFYLIYKMILQSKEKKAILETLTDATSPFSDTKTQKIFRNTANLTLKGTTFDATHLDNFLNSKYGQARSGYKTSTHGGLSRTYAKKASASFVVASSQIRPSVAFVSMDREHPTVQTYVDVYDGPSSLQKRDQIATLKEKERGPLLFEIEQ
jgi:hypothetical protein